MVTTTEIAPDLYRLSVPAPQFNLQFNHFLLVDDEPLLFHTGMNGMFPVLREAVARVMPIDRLRWISFSHFEVDECGSLNQWLQLAPRAQAACSQVGAMVNLADFAIRPPRGLVKDEVLVTGKYRLRFRPTPHLPHGWDAGVLFEETQRTLFCSDLFHQVGEREPLTESDVLGRTREALVGYQAGPLMDYLPFTPYTRKLLTDLAELRPATLAIMHGSAYRGDGRQALLGLADVLQDVFGQPRD
jgi:flavorubredoxin